MKALAESGVRYAGPKSTPWQDSSSNNAGYLVNGKLSFAVMKHTSNFFTILSCISSSSLAFHCQLMTKKCPIVVDVAADSPLGLERSTFNLAITQLCERH